MNEATYQITANGRFIAGNLWLKQTTAIVEALLDGAAIVGQPMPEIQVLPE